MLVDLIGSSFETAQVNLSSQRTINWLLRDSNNPGAKVKRAMVPVPGAISALVVDLNGAPCRGLYTSSSGPGPDFTPRVYGCWGNAVYQFNSGLTGKKLIGNIANSGNPVSMTDNGFKFVVVDNFNMYSYDLDTPEAAPTLMSAVALPQQPGTTHLMKPSFVCFLGQRLIINSTQSNQWMYSDLPLAATPITFQPDSFYSAESSSDPVLGMCVNNGTLWIWGFRSYECWRSNDNQDDPYSFVAGSQSSIGVQAPGSIATIHNQVFFLGSSDVGAAGVYMGTGTTVERISDTALEDQIMSLGYSVQLSATGWAYSWKGQMFYVLSFPAGDRTWVYEVQTGTWCERLKRDFAAGTWKYYPYVYGTYFQGRIWCGLSYGGGDLCYFDDDTYVDHDGNTIVRWRISPVYYDGLNNIQLREVHVDCETGVTPLLVGNGSDPKLLLEVSKDGGYTYGDLKPKSVGKQGQYRKVVRWNSLGTTRAATLRLTWAEPAPMTIMQANLTYSSCGRT